MNSVTKERLEKYMEAMRNYNTSELDTFDKSELRAIENVFQQAMRDMVKNDREDPDHLIISAYEQLYPDDDHPHSKTLEAIIESHRYDAECVYSYIQSSENLEVRFIWEMFDEQAPNISDPDDTEAFGKWITDKCEELKEKLNNRRTM